MTPEQRFEAFQDIARRAAGAACKRGRFRRQDLSAAENAALVGLWQAACRFEPARNRLGEAGFPQFARMRCKGAVLDWIWWELARPKVSALRPDPLRGDVLLRERDRDAEGAGDLLAELFKSLPSRKRRAFELLALGLTNREVGAHLGVCKERVSQIYAECLPGLREALAAMAEQRS